MFAIKTRSTKISLGNATATVMPLLTLLDSFTDQPQFLVFFRNHTILCSTHKQLREPNVVYQNEMRQSFYQIDQNI